MIYGHFIEHFHRQIYGGLYDPKSPFSDEKGLRLDVLEAMRKIKVPVLRWPGGCFASSYHWKDAVGPERKPYFDKAWRVEESNAFGTDEYMDLCEKLGCQPYICTNAGTGTSEEMSDWVEYCNLEREGRYAKWRSENGHPRPYGVKYWSIGNENYGDWEIGAKSAQQWGRLVKESAKMIKHIDPTTELTAAALTDLDWNISLLKNCSDFLDWISIHEYWDPLQEKNQCATYEEAMAYTNHVDDSIENIQGLLTAMNLKGKIKIAFDEWNLRSWYHPNVFHQPMGVTKEEYLTPRDENVATIVIIGLGLVQMTVLARIIDNHQFGLLTVSLVIIALADTLSDFGIANSIIQRKEISHLELTTLYWLNVGLGIFVFVLVFLLSDTIASVLHNPDLAPLMRTLSFAFVVIPHAINNNCV